MVSIPGAALALLTAALPTTAVAADAPALFNAVPSPPAGIAAAHTGL